MYDWFPIVFIVFKVVVLGTGMFFAGRTGSGSLTRSARDRERGQVHLL